MTQQERWQHLADCGVPREWRPDALGWWKTARRFLKCDDEFVAAIVTHVWETRWRPEPWNPAQYLNGRWAVTSVADKVRKAQRERATPVTGALEAFARKILKGVA